MGLLLATHKKSVTDFSVTDFLCVARNKNLTWRVASCHWEEERGNHLWERLPLQNRCHCPSEALPGRPAHRKLLFTYLLCIGNYYLPTLLRRPAPSHVPWGQRSGFSLVMYPPPHMTYMCPPPHMTHTTRRYRSHVPWGQRSGFFFVAKKLVFSVAACVVSNPPSVLSRWI